MNKLEDKSDQQEIEDASEKGPLKSFLQHLKTKTWHVILLIVTSVYVSLNWRAIGSFDTLNVNSLIFIIWLMMLLYPLFSEMEMFGVKLKKEIEKVNENIGVLIKEFNQYFDGSTHINNNNVLPDQLSAPIKDINKMLVDLSDTIKNKSANGCSCALFPICYSAEFDQPELYELTTNSEIDSAIVADYLVKFRRLNLGLDICWIKRQIYTHLSRIVRCGNAYNGCDSIYMLLDYARQSRLISEDIAKKTLLLLQVIDFVILHGWLNPIGESHEHFIEGASINVLEDLRNC